MQDTISPLLSKCAMIELNHYPLTIYITKQWEIAHLVRQFHDDLPAQFPEATSSASICHILRLYPLLGGLNHFEKILVNGKDYPIYEMENKACLKPPTSLT